MKTKAKNEVEFICNQGFIGSPPPQEAAKFLPDWYRKMPNQGDNKFHGPGGPRSQTVKRCLPFLDACTAGYIIPLWRDLAVCRDDNGYAQFSWRKLFDSDNSVVDDQDGIEGMPGFHEAYKLISPWSVKTPPGVSCLFTSPLNHFAGLPFEVFSGIVDTDVYHNEINFPFLWKDREFEGTLHLGTPIIQAIPFRRESFDLVVRDAEDDDKCLTESIKNTILSRFENAYRDLYWFKK